MDTRNEDGRWVTSGRSENSVMVREELMFGSLSSHALFLLNAEGYHS
jgi:hypothetical protein